MNRTDLLSRLWPLLKPPRHEYDECDECHGCDECNEYDGCDEGGILDSKEVRNCCQLLKRRQAAQCFPFLSFPFLFFCHRPVRRRVPFDGVLLCPLYGGGYATRPACPVQRTGPRDGTAL